MALVNFPVTAVLKSVNTDSSLDDDGNPDVQFITCTVTFTPSVNQVHSALDGVVYRLQPVRGRTNPEDGVLKTIDGNTLTLVANSAALALPQLLYTVRFSDVVYDKGDREIEAFAFEAPTTSTAVDLSTVTRIPV